MTRRLAGRYVLGDQLGAGGTSRVHAAVDERLGRRVAVKLLDTGIVAAADPVGRERFLQEGQTTAGFSHRHAVTVFDAGEDDGDLFIVMELVEGPSLAEYLHRIGPLPVDETIRLAGQVLSVLAAAHAAGIVHRDVKPANILIGADGETKLADFGIAKRFDDLDASVTSVGMVIGTPRYLAPEQALGLPVTPATDVYAMGIVMFEMLTGRRPFEADSPAAAALAQQSRTAPDVRSVRPDVPTALAAVIASALAIEPGDRPATAAELLALLDATTSTSATTTLDATQVMDSATRPATAHSDATEVLPVGSTILGSAPRRDRTGRRAVVMFAVLLVVLGGVIAAATLDSEDSANPSLDDAVVTVAADTAATTITDTQPPATTLPVIELTVAEPAETIQLPVDEVIPGFPATDDIEVFLAQVDGDPELIGVSGEALADDLRGVIERRGVKQRKAAEDLQDELAVWVEAGEIHPAIAVALDELLAPLV